MAVGTSPRGVRCTVVPHGADKATMQIYWSVVMKDSNCQMILQSGLHHFRFALLLEGPVSGGGEEVPADEIEN